MITKNPMTAPAISTAASTFVMPISGIDLGYSRACTTAVATSVVRDRKAVTTVMGADQGVAPASFPGSTAWRPPNC